MTHSVGLKDLIGSKVRHMCLYICIQNITHFIEYKFQIQARVSLSTDSLTFMGKPKIRAKKVKPKKRAATNKATPKKKAVAKKRASKKVSSNSNLNYYNFEASQVTCNGFGGCGWRGLGKETETESFDELFKFFCPKCGIGIGLVTYPFEFETRDAAGQGNPEANRELAGIERGKIQAEKILGSQINQINELNDISDQYIDIEFWLDGPDDWLVISGNGAELGRELCFFESIEPVERLLPLLKEKFGNRLKTFKWERAELYLCGDKSSLGGQIFNLIKSYGLN